MRKVTHKEVLHYLSYGSSTRLIFCCGSGLVAEEREREEGKHAIFFSNSNAGEAEAFIGVKKPRELSNSLEI